MWWSSRFQIWLAGGKAVRLMPSALAVKAPPRFDGLLLGGGADIDPSRYGQEILGSAKMSLRRLAQGPDSLWRGTKNLLRRIIHANAFSGSIDRPRDAMEFEILGKAVEERVPILGTCRGAQLINVYFGGDLYQTIDQFYADSKKYATIFPRKPVAFNPQSEFAKIVRKGEIKVNSLHSQALHRVPSKLSVVGREPNGIVQAFEAKGSEPILGVQWHPEFLPYRREQRAIFRWLVEHARIRRERRSAQLRKLPHENGFQIKT